MTVDDEPPLLRDLMRLKPDELSANAWAVRAGVSRNVWTDLRRHGNPSRRTLEKLLTAAGSSLAEFEALRTGEASNRPLSAVGLGEPAPRPWPGAPLSPIPLIETALAAGRDRPSGDLILSSTDRKGGTVDRPLSLAADHGAFAITMVGDSMWPRFRAGRRLIVSGRQKAQSGDDVLVILRQLESGDRGALVGELFAQGRDSISLRQFQPDRQFDIAVADIAAVHRIVGEAL